MVVLSGMRYFLRSSFELLRNQPPIFAGSVDGLKNSTASSKGGSVWERTSLTTTFGQGRKLLSAGDWVVVKLTMLGEPSGKRPCEISGCCWPKVTESITVPDGANRP